MRFLFYTIFCGHPCWVPVPRRCPSSTRDKCGSYSTPFVIVIRVGYRSPDGTRAVPKIMESYETLWNPITSFMWLESLGQSLVFLLQDQLSLATCLSRARALWTPACIVAGKSFTGHVLSHSGNIWNTFEIHKYDKKCKHNMKIIYEIHMQIMWKWQIILFSHIFSYDVHVFFILLGPGTWRMSQTGVKVPVRAWPGAALEPRLGSRTP